MSEHLNPEEYKKAEGISREFEEAAQRGLLGDVDATLEDLSKKLRDSTLSNSRRNEEDKTPASSREDWRPREIEEVIAAAKNFTLLYTKLRDTLQNNLHLLSQSEKPEKPLDVLIYQYFSEAHRVAGIHFSALENLRKDNSDSEYVGYQFLTAQSQLQLILQRVERRFHDEGLT